MNIKGSNKTDNDLNRVMRDVFSMYTEGSNKECYTGFALSELFFSFDIVDNTNRGVLNNVFRMNILDN